MSVTVYVPRDAAAKAMGADVVTAAIAGQADARGLSLDIVRNGSRGLLWLEPLVEVQTRAGRIAYGPVGLADVPSLFDAGWLEGGAHPLRLGPTEEIAQLRRQQRLLFARCGLDAPLAPVPWRGLQAALELPPQALVQQVLDADLRGRDGSPSGLRWGSVAQAASAQKFVVCNAAEGHSGSFADRLLLEGDPYRLIEGMAIAALAVGASRGFVYVRAEYPHAIASLERALQAARQAGVLGRSMLGSGPAFDVELRVGGGSSVCGEETAMLECLEGRGAIVRERPPRPDAAGLFGRPTLIHDVLGFAAVPVLLEQGAAFYRDFGSGRPRGPRPFQLSGNVRCAGLFELSAGLSLRELVFEIGGGTRSGRPVKAIQVGGPLGAYVPESRWDLPLDGAASAGRGPVPGHAGIVVHDDTADMAQLARYAMEFCAAEACGRCASCRDGAPRGAEVIDRILMNDRRAQHVRVLRALCDSMRSTSQCTLGGTTPDPVLSALDHYPQDFGLVDAGARAA